MSNTGSTCITINFVMSPLSADMSFTVEAFQDAHPGIFGEAGAFGQVFALFTVALAAATTLGPILAGFLSSDKGWGTMVMVLGIFVATGALPTLFFTGGLITKRRISIPED